MGDRPSPKNGRTVRYQDPSLIHTKEDMEYVVKAATRQAREKLLLELGITELNSPSTPSSRAVEKGEARRFMELLDEERGSLCMGNHTDDELASELFIHGNMDSYSNGQAILTGKPSSIAYLMAGKERIRWLSRHLDAALGREQELLQEKARALIKLDEQALALDKLQQSLERLEANLTGFSANHGPSPMAEKFNSVVSVAGLNLSDDHSSVEPQ